MLTHTAITIDARAITIAGNWMRTFMPVDNKRYSIWLFFIEDDNTRKCVVHKK